MDQSVPIDCGAALTKALLNLHVAIVESGAQVTSQPLPTVVAEEVMLIQVFQNLISNCIKFKGAETPADPYFGGERRGRMAVFRARQWNGNRTAGLRPRVRHV